VGTANPWKVADWPRAEWSVIANEKQKRSFDSYEASGEVSQSSIRRAGRRQVIKSRGPKRMQSTNGG
jgi:hypothetical protein